MNDTKPKQFLDVEVNIKIKLALLWIAVTLCYLYGDYFELYVPGKVEGLISGENNLNSPLTLFLAAVLLAIPSIMVFISITTKPRINRALNILFGALFTVIMILIALGSLGTWYIFYTFLAVLEIIFTILIVWYAIKWPRAG